MQYLFLFLFLTACGQKTENAELKPEAAAKNITNIALAKYEAREALTEEEYLSLRKPVPDWITYKRLVRVEDGFDNLPVFYLKTNIVAPSLEWCGIIYYDPKKESYYQGIFKPTNMDGLNTLIQSKKNPTQEVYGRNRTILITNISPSLHIYADAYNKYRLYALELKSTIDDYGSLLIQDGITIYSQEYLPHNSKESNITITWKAKTNCSFIGSIDYYALANGTPTVPPIIRPYAEGEDYMVDITNTVHQPFTNSFTGNNPMSYSEDAKYIYYGLKYDYFGDIATLTNEKPPMKTNYITYYEYDSDRGEFARNPESGAFVLN